MQMERNTGFLFSKISLTKNMLKKIQINCFIVNKYNIINKLINVYY